MQEWPSGARRLTLPGLRKTDTCPKTEPLYGQVASLDFPIAFRTAGLDRAAGLRATDAARQDNRAKTQVFWRGKLLINAAGLPVLLPLGHPALGDCRDAPVFLGLTPDGPRFAADLALWP